VNSTHSRIARSIGAIVIVAAAVCLLNPTPVNACSGTAPPLFCAKTYALAKAVPNANIAANQAVAVRVNTLHFLNLIEFPQGSGECPALPATLTISASLDCDTAPDAGPFAFGPFDLNEEFTAIPIDIPVPAGPARVCDVIVTGTVAFADGMTIEQTADQTICVLDSAPTDPTEPVLDVELIGEDITRSHPGDGRQFCFRITNNHDSAIFDGSGQAVTRNVSDYPDVIAGDNNTNTGVYALADPGDGDAWVIDLGDDPVCYDLPERPHEHTGDPFTFSIVLLPGESTEVKIGARSFTMCPTGSCNEATLRVSGFLDGEAVTACAGFAMAADAAQPADFDCPDSIRAMIASAGTNPIGPAIVVTGDPSPDQMQPVELRLVLDIKSMQLLVNDQPIQSGNPSFSTVAGVDGQYANLIAEFSFIQPNAPADAIFQMIYDLVLEPGPGVCDALFTKTQHVPGAPNIFNDRVATVVTEATARTNCRSTARSGEIVNPFRVAFMQQLSAVGIQSGFTPVEMMKLSFDVVQTTPNRYRVTSEWTALQRGGSFIGFDVFNHTRAVAGRLTCPTDLNGDGLTDTADLGILISAFGASDPTADINNDGAVDTADLGVLIGAFGAPCP